MSKHEVFSEPQAYTPESLAAHWGVSATSIRAQCRAGQIRHFKLGKLYRIPVKVVEEIEKCQTSASGDSAVDYVSIGTSMESAHGISLRHAPERKQRPKP